MNALSALGTEDNFSTLPVSCRYGRGTRWTGKTNHSAPSRVGEERAMPKASATKKGAPNQDTAPRTLARGHAEQSLADAPLRGRGPSAASAWIQGQSPGLRFPRKQFLDARASIQVFRTAPTVCGRVHAVVLLQNWIQISGAMPDTTKASIALRTSAHNEKSPRERPFCFAFSHARR